MAREYMVYIFKGKKIFSLPLFLCLQVHVWINMMISFRNTLRAIISYSRQFMVLLFPSGRRVGGYAEKKGPLFLCIL